MQQAGIIKRIWPHLSGSEAERLDAESDAAISQKYSGKWPLNESAYQKAQWLFATLGTPLRLKSASAP